MSKDIQLTSQRTNASAPPGPSGPAAASPLKPPTPYFPRVSDVSGDIPAAAAWRIMRRHKWVIGAFGVTVVALVTAASLFMKPKYEAVGRMVVVFHRDNDNGVLGFKGVDTSLLQDPEDGAAIDTQTSILRTDALALQVIKSLQLDTNPKFTGGSINSADDDRLVKLFHNNLAISKLKGTRLIEIRFRSADPQLAADVVNGLAKEYVDQYYQTQFKVSAQISDFLANQLKELQAKVEESQQKLVDYQKENGIFGLDEKQNTVTAKLGDLNKELTAAEADRVQKEVNYRLARSGQPDLLAKLGPDSSLTRLGAQQDDLERQIAQSSVQLGPANPKMVELAKQLAQVRRSIDAEEKRIAGRLTYEYRSALGRERMLGASLEQQKQVADELNARAVQSDILKHEFETNRKLYEDLLQKQKEVGISSSLKSSNIWIVDPARPPELPIQPNIPRNVALAVVCGSFGGVLLAFGLEKLHEQTISTVEQARGLLSQPVLGAVPLLDAKRRNAPAHPRRNRNGHVDPALVSLLQPVSLTAECYKGILTSLLLTQAKPPSAILVTSALPREGKTTVSTNLAILLARLRRRVLLVDGDLRRPGIHLALKLNARTGLGGLLRNSVAFEEAAVSLPQLPNLVVLPAGPVVLPDDGELMTLKFKELVEDWRKQFDHIIIDTPPLLPLADAVSMSVEADSVIMVIRAGQVTKETFLRAQDLLLKVNACLAGFVLNGVQLDSSEFQYYHTYYGRDQMKHLGQGT